MSSDDELVAQYLTRLDAAAIGMPSDRRRELIDEITAHIAEARAADPPQPGGIRAVFDQLGSPEDIVRAAGSAPYGAPPLRSGSRLGPMEIIAVIALLIGGIVIPFVGWVVGVVLLWISPRWRPRDKLLATLVWPGGLAAPALVIFLFGASALVTVGQVCSSGSGVLVGSDGSQQSISSGQTCVSAAPLVPPWLAITIAVIVILVSLAGPIYVAIRLIRRAREPEAIADAGTDLLAPTFSA